MDISERVRNVISDLDITQTVLSKRLDIPYSTFNGYMRRSNRFPPDVIRAIAEELDITTDYLFELAKYPDRPLELSRTERKLVENFRTLSKQQKELILHDVAFMQAQNRSG